MSNKSLDKQLTNHKKVAVIGGGIGGVQASLDLAEMGIEVYLIERAPSIGGRMAQLDKTFPTNDCAMCILSPKLVEVGDHSNVNIITNAELQQVSGDPGNFTIQVIKKARYVDEENCTGCGICVEKCPVKISDEYNEDLNKTKCIHIPFPQAVPAIPIIDRANCIYFQRGKCRICEKFCEPNAVDFEQKDESIKLEVGSIILASGLSEFNAVLKGEYGYKTFPDVVTSIEFERMLCASGPTQGHLLRPSNGKKPKKIAFIQCVGSRDMKIGNEYCSAVCCMQAAKDSVIIKEHIKDAQTTIFHMDIRAYGKDFDKFIDRAANSYETQFIRARVASVEPNPENNNLIIQYNLNNGQQDRGEFDLVILSVGMESKDTSLAQRMGLELDNCGFVKTGVFNPVATSRPGIFVCGTLSGPKDIPETVMEASGAAGAAASVVAGLPAKEIELGYPPEEDIGGQPLRIGVFICDCGINIAGTVDVPKVVEYTARLPNVAHAEELLFSCSKDAQKLIAGRIKEKGLNRVIVSACTPRTHESLFQTTLRTAGINPDLFEFVNIREQCSWVHQKEPDVATTKACELVRMGVSKARLLEPLKRLSVDVDNKALVIGGGVAGMTAALDIAEQGFEVHLVEKEDELGGNLRHIYYSLKEENVVESLKSIVETVKSHPRIKCYTNATIEELTGYVGNFKTIVKNNEENHEIRHGVVVVATGAKEAETSKYLYGQDKRVITQRELERRLWDNQDLKPDIKNVVMIQCVESRDDNHPYCSRVCCSHAIKHALKLREKYPDANIYILYRDVRMYGTRELYYKKSREKGTIFLRYEKDQEPVVNINNGNLSVRVREPFINKDLMISADLLVLSLGISAPKENKALSQLLKVPLNEDNFFLEAHVKLRPVDFATDGIFVCGLAHYPKSIDESIAQAKAAAARACTILSKKRIEAEGKVAQVGPWCSGCGVCVSVCPFNAIELDESKHIAVVNEALCKGCGTCAASCWQSAIDIKGFKDEQVLAALNAIQ